MSFRRLAATFGVEFGHSFRRPLFIVLALIIALMSYGLSSGQLQISSGDSTVGGMKAWITSEFAQTQTMTYLTLLYYAFFIAAGAGLTLLRDRESKVDVILHSTPLTAGEYVWGRFLAVTGGFVVLVISVRLNSLELSMIAIQRRRPSRSNFAVVSRGSSVIALKLLPEL